MVPVPVPQRWFRIHESLPLYYRSESCSFFSGFEDARKNSWYKKVFLLISVLWIRDIFVWIRDIFVRIRIHNTAYY